MRLGRALIFLRASEGITQGEAAARIGISKSTLSRIEAGRECDLQSLVAILDWLVVDPPLAIARTLIPAADECPAEVSDVD